MKLIVTKIALASISLVFISHVQAVMKINDNEVKNIPGTILSTPIEHSLIIPVEIKGEMYNFVVDTGASLTVIDSQLAKTITQPVAFKSLPANYQIEFAQLVTPSESIASSNLHFFKPQPIRIGNEVISDNDVWLSQDLSLYSQALGARIDGIIGIDTFRQINWLVDNQKKQLTLAKQSPPLSNYQACIGYQDQRNSSPELMVKYNEYDLSARIDTGADQSYFGQNFIQYLKQNKANITPEINQGQRMDANGLATPNSYLLSGLFYNGLPLGKLKVTENKNNRYALGLDFLSRFDHYAFMPSKMLFCYSANSIEKQQTLSVRVISIRYINQDIEVYYNDDGVLNSLGLNNGDIILAVNGINYAPLQINRVRELISQIPLGELKFIMLNL